MKETFDLTNSQYLNKKPIKMGCVYSNPNNTGGNGRGALYNPNGIAPVIMSMSGGAISRLY